LIADAKGDLFGTTYAGSANGKSTVFELVKTASGYIEKILHRLSVSTTDGAVPDAGLIADAKGDLFGTTDGTTNGSGDGTVFEFAKTGPGYTEKILHFFSGGDGANPAAGLIADANSDLFGTTVNGGASSYGTVFELVKTASGYTENVLHSFSGTSADPSTSIAETHNGVVGLDSLLPPVPGAETYMGGLADRSDGNLGGGRDVFSVGVRWGGQIGHGPGPG
jgi:uncharacterized repeat protein (TIGR03803 family)